MTKLYLLALCAFSLQTTFAQTSPGGVSTGLSLWLKADASSTLSSSDSLDSWTYANNSSNVFTATAGSRPIVQASSFNFLPGVVFAGAQLMDGPTGPGSAPIPYGQLNYSIIAVWKSTIPAATQRVWSQRGFSSGVGNGGSLWLFGNQYGDQPEISPYTTGLGLSYTPGSAYLSELNLLNQNTSDLEITDQTNFSSGPLVLSTDPANNATVDRVITTDYNRLGARTNPSDESLTGAIAELIVYTNSVSAGADKNKIFSYLSMKYGIPLGTSLVASDGSTIWDATAGAYSGYNNQIFGLGRDNTSGLLVTQSNSSASGSGNGNGQAGSGNLVLSNPSALTGDLNFLTVGNNNGALTESTTGAPTTPSGLSILGRNWKVAHTGNVGTVDVSIDYSNLIPQGTIGVPGDFRLLVDETGTGDYVSNAPTAYAPASFSGSVVQYTGVTLNNGVVFTFGSTASPLPVNWVSFAASVANSDITLNWKVANNEQAKSYIVQHSSDGVNFSQVGEVDNLPTVTTYSFPYPNAAAGTHYFRVLETDLDGEAIYSKTVAVNIKPADFSIRLMNNPVQTDQVALEVTAIKSAKADFELWTLSGVKVAALVQTISEGVTTITIPTMDLPAGSYILKVKAGDAVLTQKVLKL